MVAFFACIALSVLLFILLWMAKTTGRAESQEEVGQLKAERAAQDEKLRFIEADLVYDKIRINDLGIELSKIKSQKKSSEVRTGLIAEQMAPFLDSFPYDPKQACFIAKPIDFVVFSEDAIHFVEVKSGAAQLSTKQRRVRDQVKEGKVTFEVYRVKGDK